MKKSRPLTLLIGLLAGLAYAFLAMMVVRFSYLNVSVGYIFILPLILGAIPVLFSTKEQLKTYTVFLLWPWVIVMSFFFVSFLSGFEGMLCLIVIVGPFILIGTLGAFLVRLVRLKRDGKGTKLYMSLTIPFLFFAFEANFEPTDQFHTVNTTIEIAADASTAWNNLKNVRNIKAGEISPHFIHFIGIPKPLDGCLDREAVGGVRHIVWEKGIKFQEKITTWKEGNGFSYDINVDPKSIPPTTLDEHVMIGGKYFDVVSGFYKIDSLNAGQCKVTLSCTYRVTTNLNWYSKLWADYILDDFNEMILEVIKKRSEKPKAAKNER